MQSFFNLMEMMPALPFAAAWMWWLPIFVILLAGRDARVRRLAPWAAGVLGATAVGMLAWLTYRYSTTLIYLNPMPVQISCAAWYLVEGHPLYHAPDAAEIHNMLYGPWLYLFVGWFEKLCGPSVLAAKLPGALATGATLALLPGLLCRRGAELGMALLLTGVFAALIVYDPLSEYLDRADNFMVLFLVLAAWAAYSPKIWAPVALGACAGICMGLKAHAALFFLPLAWVAWRTGHRGGGVVAAAVAAAAVTFVPFALSQNISLANYLQVLHSTTHHGLTLPNFAGTGLYAAGLTVPVLAYVAGMYLQDAPETLKTLQKLGGLILTLLLAFLILLVPASKNGAGPHHLLPLAIPGLLLALELRLAGPTLRWPGNFAQSALVAVAWSCAVACIAGAVVRCHQYANYFRDGNALNQRLQTEAAQVREHYGQDHILLMGTSDNNHYEWTYCRTELIFHGQPMGIDPTSWMEISFTGTAMPSLDQITHTLSAREPGKKILWLIPRDGAPFSMYNYYAEWSHGEYLPSPRAYDAKFREDFAREFHRLSSTEHFDLYTN